MEEISLKLKKEVLKWLKTDDDFYFRNFDNLIFKVPLKPNLTNKIIVFIKPIIIDRIIDETPVKRHSFIVAHFDIDENSKYKINHFERISPMSHAPINYLGYEGEKI